MRWANCVRVAAQVFGDAVASPVVQQAAKLLFADRRPTPIDGALTGVTSCGPSKRSRMTSCWLNKTSLVGTQARPPTRAVDEDPTHSGASRRKPGQGWPSGAQ